ncbi:MAG: tRNA(Ile)-lysidine synthetase, partial [Rhodobacterales bacterium CG_4_10_14_0_8_um_filter_70_9]
MLLNDPAPAALAALDALAPGPALGVAVSGGGDSVALMRLAAL